MIRQARAKTALVEFTVLMCWNPALGLGDFGGRIFGEGKNINELIFNFGPIQIQEIKRPLADRTPEFPNREICVTFFRGENFNLSLDC